MKLIRIIDRDRESDKKVPPYYDLPAGVAPPAIGDEVDVQEYVAGIGPYGPAIKQTVTGIVRLSEKPERYRLLFFGYTP